MACDKFRGVTYDQKKTFPDVDDGGNRWRLRSGLCLRLDDATASGSPGSSLVEMQDHISGLQKNLDTFKQLQATLTGK